MSECVCARAFVRIRAGFVPGVIGIVPFGAWGRRGRRHHPRPCMRVLRGLLLPPLQDESRQKKTGPQGPLLLAHRCTLLFLPFDLHLSRSLSPNMCSLPAGPTSLLSIPAPALPALSSRLPCCAQSHTQVQVVPGPEDEHQAASSSCDVESAAGRTGDEVTGLVSSPTGKEESAAADGPPADGGSVDAGLAAVGNEPASAVVDGQGPGDVGKEEEEEAEREGGVEGERQVNGGGQGGQIEPEPGDNAGEGGVHEGEAVDGEEALAVGTAAEGADERDEDAERAVSGCQLCRGQGGGLRACVGLPVCGCVISCKRRCRKCVCYVFFVRVVCMCVVCGGICVYSSGV